MTTIHTKYHCDLRTVSTHLATGNEITTDAPMDNNGKGETFSPTDLLVTALGSCILTLMGIVAAKNGFNIDNTELDALKIMAENPRRVAEIQITVKLPHGNYSEIEKKIMHNAAVNCPVAKSLNADLKQKIEFIYPE